MTTADEIRAAFDEGFALSKMGSPIETAWERSDARQAAGNQPPPALWQPIDTRPTDGTWIQTIAKNGAGFWCVPQSMRWFHGAWDNGIIDSLAGYHVPLFWRPLPSPPGNLR